MIYKRVYTYVWYSKPALHFCTNPRASLLWKCLSVAQTQAGRFNSFVEAVNEDGQDTQSCSLIAACLLWFRQVKSGFHPTITQSHSQNV